MNSLENTFRQDIQNGQAALCDFMKMALYQAKPHIFDRLDFDNDEAFLEPLLFSYLRNEASADLMTIEQILCYYFVDKTGNIPAKSDEKGIIYLPKIGYFYTQKPNQDFDISFRDGEYRIDGLSYPFENVQKLVEIKRS